MGEGRRGRGLCDVTRFFGRVPSCLNSQGRKRVLRKQLPPQRPRASLFHVSGQWCFHNTEPQRGSQMRLPNSRQAASVFEGCAGGSSSICADALVLCVKDDIATQGDREVSVSKEEKSADVITALQKSICMVTQTCNLTRCPNVSDPTMKPSRKLSAVVLLPHCL